MVKPKFIFIAEIEFSIKYFIHLLYNKFNNLLTKLP